jgi:hypothetical protein
MRVKRTIPIASASDVPKVVLGDADWRRIQEGQGHVLSVEIRKLIQKVTQSYITSATFQMNAEPAERAQAKIDEISRAAKSLWGALLTNDNSDAAFYARRLIAKNFQDSRMPEGTRKLQSLTELMGEFVRACNAAQTELCNNGGSTPWEPWEEWIRSLTTMFQSHGLPTGARNDTDKRPDDTSSSPFVAFVWKLQNTLPEIYRRSTQSKGALAKAISRARDVNHRA